MIIYCSILGAINIYESWLKYFLLSRPSSKLTELLVLDLTFLDKEFDYDERIKFLDGITYKDVSDVIDEYFDITKASVATVGSKRSAIKI